MKSKFIMGLSITAILLIFVIGIPIIQSQAANPSGATTWTGNFDNFSPSSSSWGLDSSQGGNWGWPDMKSVADATTPDKHQALKVHYQWGSSAPSCSDCNGAVGGGQFYTSFSRTQSPALAQAKTLYLQYYVKFPTGFDFGKAGKLPGLYGGSNKNVSGGKHSTSAFSARHMWRVEHGQPDGETYAYLLNSPQYGTDLGLGKWTFSADDKWHSIQQEVQLPTGSQANGVITDWYDGKLVNTATNQAIPPNVPLTGIFFSTFFGGHATVWGPKKPAGASGDGEDAFFSDFTVSTQQITTTTTPSSGPSAGGTTTLTADGIFKEESTLLGSYTLSAKGQAELKKITKQLSTPATQDAALDSVVTDLISGRATPTSAYSNLEADLKPHSSELTSQLLAWVNQQTSPTTPITDLKTAMGSQTFSAYVLSLPPASTYTPAVGSTTLTAAAVYTEEATVAYKLSKAGRADLATIAKLGFLADREAALDYVVSDVVSGAPMEEATADFPTLELDLHARQADLTSQLLAWINQQDTGETPITDLKTAMGNHTFSAYVLSLNLDPSTTVDSTGKCSDKQSDATSTKCSSKNSN